MNSQLFFIFLISFSFFTANAYAATLSINLNEQTNVTNLKAVVTGTAIPESRAEEQFNAGGQAILESVNTGNYAINIINENNQIFSVDIQDPDQCDSVIASNNDNEICDVTIDNDFNDDVGIPIGEGGTFGINVDTTDADVLAPAKFTVKTQISDECLSSPTCKVIKERNVPEYVHKFVSGPNQYIQVSQFPGSNLSRILIFDDDSEFRYNDTLQVEASAYPNVNPSGGGDYRLVNIEYNSCNVYIKPGQEINCIITIKPYDDLVPTNDSITQ